MRWFGDEPFDGRWAVQWNLALTAGDASGRYLRLADRPALRSRGGVQGLYAIGLCDEWIGVEIGLEWVEPAHVGWGPVETVSISEGGFERIYQGTALLITWPLGIARGREWAQRVTLTLTATPPA